MITVGCDFWFFFFQAEDGIRDGHVTGVQTCALPISPDLRPSSSAASAISVMVRKFRSGRPSMEALVPKPPMKTVSNPARSTIRAVKTSWAPRLRIMPGWARSWRMRWGPLNLFMGWVIRWGEGWLKPGMRGWGDEWIGG